MSIQYKKAQLLQVSLSLTLCSEFLHLKQVKTITKPSMLFQTPLLALLSLHLALQHPESRFVSCNDHGDGERSRLVTYGEDLSYPTFVEDRPSKKLNDAEMEVSAGVRGAHFHTENCAMQGGFKCFCIFDISYLHLHPLQIILLWNIYFVYPSSSILTARI